MVHPLYDFPHNYVNKPVSTVNVFSNLSTEKEVDKEKNNLTKFYITKKKYILKMHGRNVHN